MADAADVANDYIDIEVSRVLKVRGNVPVKAGPKLCKECDIDMPEARRSLGFSLCIDCAEDAERRKAQFADK